MPYKEKEKAEIGKIAKGRLKTPHSIDLPPECPDEEKRIRAKIDRLNVIDAESE
jgi:hypothetical protein